MSSAAFFGRPLDRRRRVGDRAALPSCNHHKQPVSGRDKTTQDTQQAGALGASEDGRLCALPVLASRFQAARAASPRTEHGSSAGFCTRHCRQSQDRDTRQCRLSSAKRKRCRDEKQRSVRTLCRLRWSSSACAAAASSAVCGRPSSPSTSFFARRFSSSCCCRQSRSCRFSSRSFSLASVSWRACLSASSRRSLRATEQ